MEREWRVSGWVRILAVAALLGVIALQAQPLWLNPDEPFPDPLWAASVVAFPAAIAWGAFRARIVLSDGQVRVVNPWGTDTFAADDVVAVLPDALSVVFDLASGSSIRSLAIQCMSRGPEPRWVDLARAVTGRDPDHG
jgi:hypothetical protein